MRPNGIRALLIATLIVAAVLSYVGQRISSPFVGWLAFAFFFVAVFLYFQWRRTLHTMRKGDETRTRTDQ